MARQSLVLFVVSDLDGQRAERLGARWRLNSIAALGVAGDEFAAVSVHANDGIPGRCELIARLRTRHAP
jgi:hypothetical protein